MPKKLEELLTGQAVGSLGRLPVTPQIQELPFNDLSWEAFEQLCWRVIEREPGISGQVARYGIQGDDQEGIDIFARRVGPGGVEESWVYQCKNYRYYPQGKLKEAIKQFKVEADQFVVIFAPPANATHRKIQREQANLEVWDGPDLSKKLKDHPDLVADFFGLAWVRPFCNPVSAEAWLAAVGRDVSTIMGTVFNELGQPFLGASVRVIAGEDGWVGTTGGEGLFEAELINPTPEITIIASHYKDDVSLSGVKTLSWDAAAGGNARLYLRAEGPLSARILWLGQRKPVDDASVVIFLKGSEIRRPFLTNGRFSTTLPIETACDLELEVPGAAVQPMRIVVRPAQDVLSFYVARACAMPRLQEVVLVQRICDDCEVGFARVPGPNDLPRSGAAPPLTSFHIGQFPVTCAQYAFYLQHEAATAKLPDGWSAPVPPQGREDHPITGIAWGEAKKYCEWLSAKTGVLHRLPSKDEWLRAAAGDDGRLYPWGDDEESLTVRCNNGEDSINQTTPVNQYPAGRSPYGVWDMVGNVWEWVSDPVEEEQANEGPDPVAGAVVHEKRFACGGSYLDRRTEANCRFTSVLRADRPYSQVGFRVLRQHLEEI